MSGVYVTDTHALVFWATDKTRRLGKRARGVFEQHEEQRAAIYVPAIVSFEVSLLVRSGVLKVDSGLRSWWATIGSDNLIMVDNTHDDVLGAHELNWEHPDLYDRMIVQTALRLGVPLITADAAITEWGGVEVIW